MFIFTIKCSIKLRSLNLHSCDTKKLTFSTCKIFCSIIFLHFYKYLIWNSKPLLFVGLSFSQFIYHILKVKFSQGWIRASAEHFLAWRCDSNLLSEELLPKSVLSSAKHTCINMEHPIMSIQNSFSNFVISWNSNTFFSWITSLTERKLLTRRVGYWLLIKWFTWSCLVLTLHI